MKKISQVFKTVFDKTKKIKFNRKEYKDEDLPTLSIVTPVNNLKDPEPEMYISAEQVGGIDDYIDSLTESITNNIFLMVLIPENYFSIEISL